MKRFTETSKWSDPWFRKLSPSSKLLWQWILDNCDGAGVIDLDIDLASFQIGIGYPLDTLSKAFEEFGERVIKLTGGKLHVPKFIQFQYGELSRDCKAHNPVFASLEKYGLKGYPKGIHTPQEKEKEKEKEKKGVQGVFQKPTLDEVKLCCEENGLPESDAVWFWNKGESNGWTNGGKAIKSWKHTVASWKAAGYMPSQKQNSNGFQQTKKPIHRLRDSNYDSTKDAA